VRKGSGLTPPLRASTPWDRDVADPMAQVIVRADGGPNAATWAQLRQASTPTVWLHTNRLTKGDADRLEQSGCTDLAIELDPTGVNQARAQTSLARTLHELRQVLNMGSTSQPQRRLRTWLALQSHAPSQDLEALIQWARAHDAMHIRLLSPEDI